MLNKNSFQTDKLIYVHLTNNCIISFLFLNMPHCSVKDRTLVGLKIQQASNRSNKEISSSIQAKLHSIMLIVSVHKFIFFSLLKTMIHDLQKVISFMRTKTCKSCYIPNKFSLANICFSSVSGKVPSGKLQKTEENLGKKWWDFEP